MAAATRHLAPFAVALAREFNSGSVHDRQRLAVAELLNEFYLLMSHSNRRLSDSARRRVPKLGSDLCRVYAILSCEAQGEQRKAWKMVPKFHLFLHLCCSQILRYGNASYYWTYADEDVVGKMMEVSRSAHPRTLATTAIYKYLVHVFDSAP